jgi:hypothetical protein
MAAQVSILHAVWRARMHQLQAALSEAQLALVERRHEPDLAQVALRARALQAWYAGLGAEKTLDLLPTVSDGLRVAQQFRELLQKLGRANEGDALYDLHDEIADHAEVVALRLCLTCPCPQDHDWVEIARRQKARIDGRLTRGERGAGQIPYGVSL